ncbi:MAG: tRNA lysidine(34) synthetase TilS [Dehalococcoidia bacterium]|jgi:tRNA(Ile)-lysidine synthase|nr:tRNA lysidine(34) synthetase TilS [Chloroflexota bacterium]MDP6056266.1 tRNA lysidine(34) synthetase TilS [Dehalococcoidia bacterium]MDP7089672.1 tRNA lysidine(34) synthetase TilS [Dehalococcoidia bacterium]MDP7261055.1 tRNA lysidine(34) synthetase TilS [Dehalococcoidia bacterium]MDP7485106.1 tRNA lysidine(34) synthetase TilS [Dehalococcoidia bacterium]|tara:strand:+ start:3002 stop:4438 length:1437 start_codon:yes stop_codon:yes gene_type:complete
MSSESKFLELLISGLDQAAVPDGSTLIVAFSGGPDSTAVLAGLAQLSANRNITLVAAHVNHQIRPATSNRDQTVAEQIARALNIEFTAINADVPTLATTNKISIESAARRLRYEALAKAVETHNAYGVVTGHTQDDQAETVLLHATRGSGLRGIAGMSYNSLLKIPDSAAELRVLRPMLDTPGAMCIEFCTQLGIEPAIDESNDSRDYTRNKVRLDVLPLLNEVTPESIRALARLAKNTSDDLEIIDWAVDQQLSIAQNTAGSYSRAVVDDLPKSLIARVLMKAYELHVGHSLNLDRSHVIDMANLLNGQSGTSIELPNQTAFYIDRESFGFRSPSNDDCPYPANLATAELPLPGTTAIGSGMTLSAEIIDRPLNLDLADAHVAFATPDLLSHSLKLRTRKNGDRFQPLGMAPQVKLQDFFIGAGVPERWRDRVPLVESDHGIVWIAGYRLAEWAKVLPEHSQVARFELAGARSQPSS